MKINRPDIPLAATVFDSVKNTQESPKTVTSNRKEHIRNLERNSSGREATVKMATYTGGKNNEKHYAAPTITFKGNEEAKSQNFDQALKAGEVYEFNSKKRAEKFAAGSWKQGQERREAMKNYRKKKI